MVRRIVITAMGLLCLGISVSAQTSEHQRIGVERNTEWEASAQLGCSMTRQTYDSADYFFLDSSAALDFMVERKWTMGIQLPWSTRVVIGDGVTQALAAGIGDVSVNAGWMGRIGDTRLSASANASAPTGQWNPYAEAEGILIAGSGRWSVGLDGSASWILDPVVLGLALSYELGLPRAERFHSTWEPGTFGLSVWATEVLNDRVGYTLRLAQQMALPTAAGSDWSLDTFSYGAKASFELWYSNGDLGFRIGVNKSLSSIDAPAAISLSLEYSIRSENNDE